MRRKIILVLLVLAMLASACSGDDAGRQADPESDPDTTESTGTTGARADRSPGPLSVRLSEGTGVGLGVAAVVATLEGEPLDTQAVVDALDRLPEWVEDGDDQVDFNRPPESLQPPIAGDPVDQPFPVGGGDPPPLVVEGPLEVLRHQPDGEVGIAPFVSLTFNQPMIALGTVEQTNNADVPVEMTPELPGRWTWIGTRTLRFEHDPELFDRLPMATSFEVTVPVGTESASGEALVADYTFTFETPSPSVEWMLPGDNPLDLEPVFVAFFDQRVDPESILGVTTISLDGQSVDIRLASDNEIAGDEELQPQMDRAVEGTTVAFRAVDPFTPDTPVRVDIGPDVSSTEGPNTTDRVFSEQRRTYAPLAVDERSCEESSPCEPDRGFNMSFNNRLDVESVGVDDIGIEPAIAGAFIQVSGSFIGVSGDLVGDTVYRVTLPASLTDRFGQTLGADEVLDFHFTSARPYLNSDTDSLITLDPLVETQTLPLELRGHDEVRVRAFDVSPAEWPGYLTYADSRWDGNNERLPTPPWTTTYDAVVATGAPEGERFEARIDLEPVFEGRPGMAVIIIEGVGDYANLSRDSERYWENQPVVVWVQSTNLGGDLLTDNSNGVAWVTDLRTGEPVEGAEINLVGSQTTSTTNADGLSEFALPAAPASGGPLIVTLGDDVALLRASGSAWTPGNQPLWHVVDDRALYRPGETASVKGWLRMLNTSDDATIEMVSPGESITYLVRDGIGTEIGSGEAVLSDLGGFDFEIDIPLGANLGNAQVELRRPATPGLNGTSHSFQIEEFRRPEFEVTARVETSGPYLVDEPATVAVDATYFSGGALPDAPVDWWVTTRPTTYSPPGWDDFTFGTWTPWWRFDRFEGDFGGYQPETSIETFAGVTNTAGTHFLQMDFDGDGEGRPTTVSASASVTDVNRQTWSSTTDVLVHAGDYYVGLYATRSFVRAGDPLDVEVIVAHIDGDAIVGRAATVVAERVRQEYVDDEWTDVVLDSEECIVESSAEPFACTFDMETGGRYRIAATVVDDAGRESTSELTTWVSGGDAVPSRRLALQDVTLVPDQMEYQPGDTAEIFVESPFGPAHGLVTITRNGILSYEPFEITGNDTILSIDILEEHVPNLGVSVELVGVTDRAADDGTVLDGVAPRPAFATGWLPLRVPPINRTLNVDVEPLDDVVEPGSSTSVSVAITDVDGAPVEGAELLVVAVDEAVLALTGYELANPIDTFYRSVSDRLETERGRSTIRLADPQALVDFARELDAVEENATRFTEGGGALGGDFAMDDSPAEDDQSLLFRSAVNANALFTGEAAIDQEGGAAPIEVRSNFDALALWDPEVSTDDQGKAVISFDLPDSLTRYRLMVVAVDGVDRFGSGEANLTARLPLQVRPSAPRFLNFGDDFELPIVVQNLTDEAMDVDVVLQTANLDIEGSPGRAVTVPANDRIEVRFPVTTNSAGTARFRAVAVTANHTDAATVSLPVYTPATAEAFATYGVVDAGATIQAVLAPEGVIPQFGGLEVTTSSTAVQALTDSVLYMMEYNYSSADAHASRILTITALRDVLEAFDVEGMPTPAEFDSVMASDISALVSLQGWDGGWSTWRRNFRTSPYRSVHVMHALYEAQANGYAVPANTLQQGGWFLQNIEEYIPQDWSTEARDTVVAYSLLARRLNGDVDSAKAQTIWNRHGIDLGLDAAAWLWPVVENETVEAEIARALSNRVTETPNAATFVTGTSEDDYLILRSDRRTDGIVLDAMIAMDPESGLIPKIVAGLIGNQRQGRWNNAQENTFILMALNNYFDTFEAATPDFVARVWLGDLYAAEHEFEGRSVDSQITNVPMADLIAGGDTDLVVSKDGDGRLYYRLGLRYAPDDFDLDPLDRGFVVERSYEAIDDDDDVWQDDDGVWHVKAGAQVRVSLTMVNDSRRTNMALIDPLPAGLEASNPALAVTADVAPEEAALTWWNWTWYDHQNLRDDRVESFANYLWAGTHEYSYVARATTPGTFVVPPARAEEIYAPEVFGRSGSDMLIIEG